MALLGKKQKKILLIEDEKILQDMYAAKLQHAGFEIVTAFTSEEGFQVAKKQKPDLILLDIILQDENGLTFLWKRQDDPKLAKTPVIVFSNYENQKTKEEAFRLGALEYLLKTEHTPNEVIQKIQTYLADSKSKKS